MATPPPAPAPAPAPSPAKPPKEANAAKKPAQAKRKKGGEEDEEREDAEAEHGESESSSDGESSESDGESSGDEKPAKPSAPKQANGKAPKRAKAAAKPQKRSAVVASLPVDPKATKWFASRKLPTASGIAAMKQFERKRAAEMWLNLPAHGFVKTVPMAEDEESVARRQRAYEESLEGEKPNLEKYFKTILPSDVEVWEHTEEHVAWLVSDYGVKDFLEANPEKSEEKDAAESYRMPLGTKFLRLLLEIPTQAAESKSGAPRPQSNTVWTTNALNPTKEATGIRFVPDQIYYDQAEAPAGKSAKRSASTEEPNEEAIEAEQAAIAKEAAAPAPKRARSAKPAAAKPAAAAATVAPTPASALAPMAGVTHVPPESRQVVEDKYNKAMTDVADAFRSMQEAQKADRSSIDLLFTHVLNRVNAMEKTMTDTLTKALAEMRELVAGNNATTASE